MHLIDTYALFEAITADPRSFGLRNMRTPCLADGAEPCTRRQARNRGFFDELHANFVVHQWLAEAVLAELDPSSASIVLAATPPPAGTPPAVAAVPSAPVPLPAPAALLLGGLFALGWATRRRLPPRARRPSRALRRSVAPGLQPARLKRRALGPEAGRLSISLGGSADHRSDPARALRLNTRHALLDAAGYEEMYAPSIGAPFGFKATITAGAVFGTGAHLRWPCNQNLPSRSRSVSSPRSRGRRAAASRSEHRQGEAVQDACGPVTQ